MNNRMKEGRRSIDCTAPFSAQKNLMRNSSTDTPCQAAAHLLKYGGG